MANRSEQLSRLVLHGYKSIADCDIEFKPLNVLICINLNLAEELGNVSKACKVMGLSRDTFYRYKAAMERRRD